MSNVTATTREIHIKGARVHNLKNIELRIPHGKMVILTGVSGSGKSSLAYDTIYAEGQRRYVESLSSYARQFMGKMHKPDVDFIHGIAPAIAIEQKVISRSSRSTVGTSSEIYDYLKLLFARIGKTYSPVSGKPVKRHTVTDIVQWIISLPAGSTITISSPLSIESSIGKQLELLVKQGFSRVSIDGQISRLSDLLELKKIKSPKTLELIIDRIALDDLSDETRSRISDSVQTALYEGKGECIIDHNSKEKPSRQTFSDKFEMDGIQFEEPSVHLFSFNNPVGACRTCEGFGSIIGIDENLVIPNKNLSVFDGAIACWKGEKMGEWKEKLIREAHKFDFPVHRPINQLSSAERKLLWTGNEYFHGLDEFFEFLERESFKIQYRVMMARYRGKTTCTECGGARLRKEAYYVKIGGKDIGQLVALQIKDLLQFFQNLELNDTDRTIGKRILTEILNRINFLNDVGLGYLTLNRLSNTLSGGESQRLNLATSLGSSLVGSLYILDEPSIGLHPRDTQRLIKVLKSLRDQGNTVLVVEHDEEIMRSSDQIIDLGPEAGTGGGEIVFEGTADGSWSGTNTKSKSHTIDYLTGKQRIELPSKRRKSKFAVSVDGSSIHNLKNVTVRFPLSSFTVVAGVSGSGKTSLVKKSLYEGLKRTLTGFHSDDMQGSSISGDIGKLTSVEIVDQNPIGKSSRSNPVTYIKAYDDIRSFYANLPLAKMRGYKSSSFSFNVDGGRCETCEGEGEVTIEMQFMADVHLECETCKGRRFKDELLEVEHKGKNISDVLQMTVDDAIDFFKEEPRIASRLQLLQDVGMGYIRLGQSSSTLSGGEAQRVKLATILSTSQQNREKGMRPSSMFIFDEPTTGLHFHDIRKLLKALNRLVDEGHSLVVIEHNPDVIKCADHVIELGPEAGTEGGYVIFEGTPEEMIKNPKSVTGKYLADKL